MDWIFRCPLIAVLGVAWLVASTHPISLAAEPIPAEVLLSRQLIEEAGLGVGDVVELSRDPDGGPTIAVRVAGVYEPTPDPMLLTVKRLEARLRLNDLLRLTRDASNPIDRESVDTINLELADPQDWIAVSRELESKLPGLSVHPSTGPADGSNPFLVLERFHLAIAMVSLVGSSAFLLALMVMRAEERRETVGILRLIGFSKPRVLLEVFVEGLLVAIVGSIFGVLLAIVLQDGFNAFFQWHYDTTLVFVHVSPKIAWRCIALAVPLGVLAGLVASWSLLRREVLELIRR